MLLSASPLPVAASDPAPAAIPPALGASAAGVLPPAAAARSGHGGITLILVTLVLFVSMDTLVKYLV